MLEEKVKDRAFLLPVIRSFREEFDRINRLDSRTIKRGQLCLNDETLVPTCSK